MSTRTDWGLFDKDGKPVAVGDEWHKWVCPHRKYEPTGYWNHMTGEWVDEGHALSEEPCRSSMKCVNAKLDRCSKCGMEFRYP